MSKQSVSFLLPIGIAVWVVVAGEAQPKAENLEHSRFFHDFDPGSVVELCHNRFSFVNEKCEEGSRGIAITWSGQESAEDFKIFYFKGELSDDEMKQVIETLQSQLVNTARGSKATLSHDPKDSILDRPMRLLQPGLVWGGTQVIPSSLRGFFFDYAQGNVGGAVDVLAISIAPCLFRACSR